MKRLDVTHEDLLAAAVLEYIGYRDSEEVLIEAVPLAVHDVLWRRHRAMPGEWWPRFRRLIVSLERWAAADEARDSIIEAARSWDGQGGLGNLDACVRDFLAAQHGGVR